jgi:tellurite resistance protein TerC
MIWAWILFGCLFVGILALDLGLFHRKAHVVRTREALAWTAVWVTLSLLFSVFLYFAYEYRWFGVEPTGDIFDGRDAAVLFITGYLVEESLSIDNVFVIAMIFTYFHVPAQYQHRVLFWGIVGAVVLRGTMIFVGSALIHRFNWVLYIFGAFLIVTAWRMLTTHGHRDPADNPLVKLAGRWFPVTTEYVGQSLLVRRDGRFTLTPLALALVAVESTDVMFALDSIPAIFAITDDPFIILTSNVFAILGMRSLYFALAGAMRRFRYLKQTLSVMLALIGLKMLLKDFLHDIPHLTYYTLGAIALVLGAGIGASLLHPEPADADDVSLPGSPAAQPGESGRRESV